MTKCYVCGRKVLLFQAKGVKVCCHRQCFELAWKFLKNKQVKLHPYVSTGTKLTTTTTNKTNYTVPTYLPIHDKLTHYNNKQPTKTLTNHSFLVDSLSQFLKRFHWKVRGL